MFILQKKQLKKGKKAEMWIEQGRENSMNGKDILMCFSYTIHKKNTVTVIIEYVSVSSSQTDAIAWNILANRSNWEHCTRTLMKNWD